ncbi:MAG: hypothetical protein ABWJ97_03330 [Thermoproteus sp.]
MWRRLLFLLGLLFMWPIPLLPVGISSIVFPVLAAYIFGVSASSAALFGFRRFWAPLAFSLAALPCSLLPWYVAIPFIFLFSGALFFFAAVWPALLYGRNRGIFIFLLVALSVVVALPSAFIPLPAGNLLPDPVLQYYLREDPLYTRLNWIRYLIDMVGYNVALYLTKSIVNRL